MVASAGGGHLLAAACLVVVAGVARCAVVLVELGLQFVVVCT